MDTTGYSNRPEWTRGPFESSLCVSSFSRDADFDSIDFYSISFSILFDTSLIRACFALVRPKSAVRLVWSQSYSRLVWTLPEYGPNTKSDSALIRSRLGSDPDLDTVGYGSPHGSWPSPAARHRIVGRRRRRRRWRRRAADAISARVTGGVRAGPGVSFLSRRVDGFTATAERTCDPRRDAGRRGSPSRPPPVPSVPFPLPIVPLSPRQSHGRRFTAPHRAADFQCTRSALRNYAAALQIKAAFTLAG